ncbi:MAG: hypothetical protein OEV43_02480 [Coriobacteriia bacterium]|nr:hypothetical protein [Coriobacteriia bacterium]
MTSRERLLSAVALAILAATVLSVSACEPRGTTTVTQSDRAASRPDTDSISPLERGQIRTKILQNVRAAISAWQASDSEDMRLYMTEDLVARFEKTWSDYEAEGLRVAHVHDVVYLDVIELNAGATQALVTYRYDDRSYLVDESSGDKVEDLPVFTNKEMQLTVDRQDDDGWLIVRVIAADDVYR